MQTLSYLFFSKCHCPLSTSRPRGLYYWGGASIASAGRRRAGAVLCGRSSVSDHDSQQADEALQCPLSHVHQQTGPDGRQPLPGPAANEVRYARSLGITKQKHM